MHCRHHFGPLAPSQDKWLYWHKWALPLVCPFPQNYSNVHRSEMVFKQILKVIEWKHCFKKKSSDCLSYGCLNGFENVMLMNSVMELLMADKLIELSSLQVQRNWNPRHLLYLVIQERATWITLVRQLIYYKTTRKSSYGPWNCATLFSSFSLQGLQLIYDKTKCTFY